ncbi:MAG TPA: WecB/TagA/CpsF family glycosyltransferase [Candidatus Coprenecus stercoravium]|uniref:WecB/TagA/CpsF family glycosyltransferase n=1 Tax=Candidatus Coprenecus stercoravium TaxID=2840735 RepID=A0A9D2GN38_9BACT|nr:WecB/TagA/CpsF family glycosyltransferase [Candidatus Coprenecus stercoravium]
MQTYFNIRYEFDRQAVAEAIERQVGSFGPGYICVADGVILDRVNRDPEYCKVVNGSMFSICDSSFVPLYIKRIYGIRYGQYCGSEIFMDIVRSRKYRMIFMGTSQGTLDGLRTELTKVNPDIPGMQFVELPYRDVHDFDYPGIADMIRQDGAQIIWVALGAPKQEIFMSLLKPHLQSGVMIAVGAAFKFYSGTDVSRAPKWMVKAHLEFVHRIIKEPRKQLRRCRNIISSLPRLLREERKRKMQTTI